MPNPLPPRRATGRLAFLLAAALAVAASPLAAQRASSAARKRSSSSTAKTTAKTSSKKSAAAATAAAPVAAARPDSALRGFQVDTLAEPIPETLVPRYPRELRSREVRGSVIAEFVVDTAGRIEPATFRVISSDDPAFTASVRELLPRARFLPAINEGKLVRQVVRQTFVFDLDVLQRPGAAGSGATGSPPSP